MLRRPPGFTRTDTLLPSTTRVRAYDTIGDAISVDGPLSGTAGTTTYRYDRDRRRVGVISPDPDGAGSLKRRAVRTSYADDGQVEKVELRSEEHTSELQSLMRISYAVFCLKKKTTTEAKTQEHVQNMYNSTETPHITN